uniref:Transposable element Tc3 transposase n=1 Tax=Sipha flava TaxID=143950 RepID=A0A2S2R813_9HEMI
MYDLPVLLENVPLEEQELMWFMLNGAPPHHTNAVRQQLHYLLPDKLIGSGVVNNAQYSPSITWPPRSPDFNPCDFFLWGFMKEQVYAKEVNNRNELNISFL